MRFWWLWSDFLISLKIFGAGSKIIDWKTFDEHILENLLEREWFPVIVVKKFISESNLENIKKHFETEFFEWIE